MVTCYVRDRLTLNNNIIFTNEIHTKCRLHGNSTILRMKCHLTNKRNLFIFQFNLQPFLIARFVKSWSQHIMDIINGSNYIIDFLF